MFEWDDVNIAHIREHRFLRHEAEEAMADAGERENTERSINDRSTHECSRKRGPVHR